MVRCAPQLLPGSFPHAHLIFLLLLRSVVRPFYSSPDRRPPASLHIVVPSARRAASVHLIFCCFVFLVEP